MLKIKGNTIYLTKGDNAKFKLHITDEDDKPYIFVSQTEIYFSVKKDIEDNQYILQKKVVNSDIIELLHEETKGLEVGRYVYDVQLVCNDKYYTIVPPSTFYIEEEVTTE